MDGVASCTTLNTVNSFPLLGCPAFMLRGRLQRRGSAVRKICLKVQILILRDLNRNHQLCNGVATEAGYIRQKRGEKWDASRSRDAGSSRSYSALR